ncbi:MAG: helix-turn-helix transcriptional regulator [Patescibacteria group bacterium]|nr:helix-turn-helix transcriptional regulator [Patescibacteria group bacterium]
MANLATTLKQEIRRLARKEVKEQTEGTKQAVVRYRREIAELKRQLVAQDRKIAKLEAGERGVRSCANDVTDEAEGETIRFSPAWVKSQRKRLGLSGAEYAKLVGVSSLTIYNWEHGKNRPRAAQLAALAAVRGIGKREAAAKLQSPEE